MIQNHTHLFICGLHRSGTSLLHSLLEEHPDISGFSETGVPEDEGQHLQSVFLPARDYGGPGKFAFNPAARLDETSPLISEANRQKLLNEWSRYWDTSKPILMEKSPPNLIRARFLQAMFPNSRFIFIVRHPVIVSLATRKWSKTDLWNLMRHWEAAHRIMLTDLPHIGSYKIIRYEDLIANPQETVAGICDFMGIKRFSPTIAIEKTIDSKYAEEWRREPGTRVLFNKFTEALFFKTMHKFGYRFPSNSPTSSGTSLLAGPCLLSSK